MNKIFVSGLISKDLSSNTPDFILGKNSIEVDQLIEWLQTIGKKHAVNGWINTVTKFSDKSKKRYIELDLYNSTNPKQPTQPSPSYSSNTSNTSDVPF